MSDSMRSLEERQRTTRAITEYIDLWVKVYKRSAIWVFGVEWDACGNRWIVENNLVFLPVSVNILEVLAFEE